MANVKKLAEKCIILNINSIGYGNNSVEIEPTSMIVCGRESRYLKKMIQGIYDKYKKGPNSIKSQEKLTEIYNSINTVLRSINKMPLDVVNLDLKSKNAKDGSRENFSISLKGLGGKKQWDWEPRAAEKFFRNIEKKALYKW